MLFGAPVVRRANSSAPLSHRALHAGAVLALGRNLCCNAMRHRLLFVIRSFANTATENLWQRGKEKSFDPRILNTALRKLRAVEAAVVISDLRIPPGNHLEQLSGDREGQYSIRINDQWRICFTWKEGDAENVEVTDYH